jgi:hypothetical protein
MSPYLIDADRSRTAESIRQRELTLVADAGELFGDRLTRALHREAAYGVPDDQRLTCPLHLDWRADCLNLHVERAATITRDAA